MNVSHAAFLLLSCSVGCYLGANAGPDAGSSADAGPTADAGVTHPTGSWEQRVMHRLTRVEYEHTVRDLLGEPSDVGGELPEDQTSALGYDNDGVSLVTSPLLVEQYFDVAGELAANLFGRLHPYGQPFTIVSEPNFGVPCSGLAAGEICGNDAAAWENGDPNTGVWGLRPSLPSTPNDLVADGVSVPLPGTYSLSLLAFATPDTGCANGTCTVELSLAIDSSAQTFDVTAVPASSPTKLVLPEHLIAGVHTLRISSVDMFDTKNPNATYDRTAWIANLRLDVAAPAATGVQAATVLDCGGAPADSDACTEHVLADFLPRAWRRPVTSGEIAAVKSVADAVTTSATETGTPADKWELGMQLAIREALTSPYFVYRPESAPLDDYALASRLSYFLWASMPDDELVARAADNTLHHPDVLDAQIDRMLADPKAVSLADDFAGQWLETRTLSTVSPSAALFPKFDGTIRDAMAGETRSFFLDFLAPGRSFPDMLDANYTFTDASLAGYYGLAFPGGPSDAFVRIALAGSQREGLLSQGSILTITSLPTRTSPVERGKFVLGRLLCDEPPPPPANVPPLDIGPGGGSMRQRLEQHVKAGIACSSCHDLLDPIGLSLENFDAVGEYRTTDGPYPVDTSGLSYEGHSISDVATLAALVKSDPRFVPCVSHQLYAYAMGQEPQEGDAATVAQLDALTTASHESLRAMIHAIVQSAPFVTRSGESP